jgi:hypothetical protein
MEACRTIDWQPAWTTWEEGAELFWRGMPVPEPLVRSGAQKLRRDQRYVELNPCRAGLAADPLEWPLSTWRDRMGLSVPLVRPRANDPARWYAFATRDDYVRAGELPYVVGVRSAADVEAAVSSVLRTPVARLRQRGPARTLLVASLRRLTELGTADIAELVGMSPSAVRAVASAGIGGVGVVERVAGDARFAALGPETLSWRAYARSQRRNADELGWAWR